MARLADTSASYGWASILLHWAAGLVIVVMLFAGASIGEDLDGGMFRLHTSLGVTAWVFLWFRLYWRLREGHPPPLPSHGRVSAAAGRVVHYAMLGLMAVMLLSGPLMIWAGGVDLNIFGLMAVRPPPPLPGMRFSTFHHIHATAGGLLAALVAAHIAGVFKHMVFDRDRTLDRILVPSLDVDPARPGEPP